MINHHGALLPSVYWVWPLGVLAFIFLGLTIAAVLASVFDHDHEHWIVAWLFPVVLIGITVGPLFGYYPYKGDYHRLQPASGVVSAVDTRFLAASQYVVVTYDTGLVVRCDDSRCATVRPGQQLRLLCTKEHQFGSPLAADGWGCRWGEQ